MACAWQLHCQKSAWRRRGIESKHLQEVPERGKKHVSIIGNVFLQSRKEAHGVSGNGIGSIELRGQERLEPVCMQVYICRYRQEQGINAITVPKKRYSWSRRNERVLSQFSQRKYDQKGRVYSYSFLEIVRRQHDVRTL